MSKHPDIEPISLTEAVEMFTSEFSRKYPESRFLIDGDGYEDEDLDLNVYLDGDEVEVGRFSAEVSNLVQQRTGYLIMPFVLPANRSPL